MILSDCNLQLRNLHLTDARRLQLVRGLAKFDGYGVDDVRLFYFALSYLADVVMYYIVPIKTVTMGTVRAHVSAESGQVIAFKGGRNLDYHVSRVKRGYLDPVIISIVDNAIEKMAQ